jgi:hypothetical protein
MSEKEFVEISELIGRVVTLYPVDFDDIEGTVNAISNNGILIKTEEEGNYELYPWWQVKCVVHETVKSKEENKKEIIGQKSTQFATPLYSDKWEPKITESPKTIVTNNLPEDYEWDWVDDDEEEEIMVTDDDGEECIDIYIDDEIKVLLKKELDLAKKLAKALNIKSVVKDYSE